MRKLWENGYYLRKNFGGMDDFYEINLGETDIFVYDNYGEIG